jgi:hypothetical protein
LVGLLANDRIAQMLITTGQVHGGAIEVDNGSLPEGTKVTILVHDDETFELSPEEEAALLAARAEAERGDSLSVSQVLGRTSNDVAHQASRGEMRNA